MQPNAPGGDWSEELDMLRSRRRALTTIFAAGAAAAFPAHAGISERPVGG